MILATTPKSAIIRQRVEDALYDFREAAERVGQIVPLAWPLTLLSTLPRPNFGPPKTSDNGCIPTPNNRRDSLLCIPRADAFNRILGGAFGPKKTKLWAGACVDANCLVLSNLPDDRLHPLKLFNRSRYASVTLSHTFVPTVAYSVYIYDYVVSPPRRPSVIILRYPQWLYRENTRDYSDRHRTIDRQRRESESIQAKYQPLDAGQAPYPFFVPEQPLDAVWTPPTYTELERKQRYGRGRRAGLHLG